MQGFFYAHLAPTMKIPAKSYYSTGQATYHFNRDQGTLYYADGSIRAEGPLRNGMPEGEWMFYDKHGRLMQTGFFREGRRHGLWSKFDRYGNISRKTFLDGRLI